MRDDRTPEQRESLHELAREAGKRAERMLQSRSGSDQAESPAYDCMRRAYVAIADGESIGNALADADERWRAYAAEQARRVEDAPKIVSGPRAGQSSISHRWVSPDHFATLVPHIAAMARRILGEEVDENGGSDEG